jgi:hypothetical protein
MAAITVTPRDNMIDWYTGKANPPLIGTRYITVFNGDPQGAGTEVISTLTGSANRQAITASMGAAAAGAAASTGNIVFTAAAVGSPAVNFVAIFDAITAGNLLGSVAVTSKTPAIGDSLSILASNLTVSIA